jgi:RNA polymerase sigma factor (sigma-70 family)
VETVQDMPRGLTGPPAGARDDLERVFRAEYPRVVAVARRVLGSDREAEDVAQEVFIAFGRTGPGQVPAAAARGWLLTAAAHTALNAIRSEDRRTRRETAVAAPERLPDVADEVLVRADRARVRAVLARLPERQALVLVLRHSGMSYAEVGAALNIPATGVGTTLRRAEAAARKEFENDESPS